MAQVNSQNRGETRPCRFSTLVSERQSIAGETSGVRSFQRAIQDVKNMNSKSENKNLSTTSKRKSAIREGDWITSKSDRNEYWNMNTETTIKNDQFKGELWHQRRSNVLKKLKRLNLHNSDYSVSKNRSFFYSDRQMKKARCYLCFVRGHMFWNCPNKNKIRSFEFKKRKSQEKRIGCEKTGTEQDSLIIPRPNWTVVGSDERGWDEIWYVSDEYPRHMTPNLDMFEHFKAGSIGTSNMGEKGLYVEGFGEVFVSTEIRTYRIAGVYLVPKCALNVLSLGQLILQGFRVRIKDSKAVIERAFEEEMTSSSEEESFDDGMDGFCKNRKDSKHVNITHSDVYKCRNQDLQELDCLKEKAINEVSKYYGAGDELSIDELLGGKKLEKIPTKNEFESLIGFMKMIHEDEIKEECKELVKNHFDKLVRWFFKDYLDYEDRVYPVKIHEDEVCLLDVYKTVQGFGGHVRVTIGNKWEDVARGLGFPKGFAQGIKDVYVKHLGLLEAYVEVAMGYSLEDLAPTAMECAGAGARMARELPRGGSIPGCKTDDERLGEEEPEKEADSSMINNDDDFIIVN